MQKIVMNEQDYISELKEKGNLGENIGYAVSLLAKLYRTQGDSIDVIKHKLETDLPKYEPRLNNKQRDAYIANALKCADNRELNNVNEILITKTEINKIMSITPCESDFKVASLRRLAFTLLCFAKFELAKGKSDPWINCDLRYVFKAAKLSGLNKSRCFLCLHELYKQGFIQPNPKVDCLNIKVTFVDRSDNGEVALKVGNINYAGDYYWQYMGRKYITCKNCGRPTPKTNNRILYCRDCAIVVNREKTRQRMMELRKNQNV